MIYPAVQYVVECDICGKREVYLAESYGTVCVPSNWVTGNIEMQGSYFPAPQNYCSFECTENAKKRYTHIGSISPIDYIRLMP